MQPERMPSRHAMDFFAELTFHVFVGALSEIDKLARLRFGEPCEGVPVCDQVA